MADIDKNEKNWLIKSSSKITGPFSAIEVAQGVIKKHISIIDEARTPYTRWSYIREYSIFSEVVESLRYEQATHVEETVTTAQNTQTLSRTDWANTDVGTPTPSFAQVGGVGESTKIKDITPLQGTSPAANSRQSSAAPSFGNAPSFGAATDQRVQNQMRLNHEVAAAIFGSSP